MSTLAATCLLEEYDVPDALVLGIGNLARRDDGLGWAFVDWLESSRWCRRTELVRCYQLHLEDAELLSRKRRVLVVDATRDPTVASYRIDRPEPRLESTFTSHALSIPSVLATTLHCFGTLIVQLKALCTQRLKISNLRFGFQFQLLFRS